MLFGFLFGGFLVLGFCFFFDVGGIKLNQNKIKSSLMSHWHFQLSFIFLTPEELWQHMVLKLNSTGKVFPQPPGCSFQVLLTSGRSNNQNPNYSQMTSRIYVHMQSNFTFKKLLILAEILVRNILECFHTVKIPCLTWYQFWVLGDANYIYLYILVTGKCPQVKTALM